MKWKLPEIGSVEETRLLLVCALLCTMFLLFGCDRGPSREDMVGCATSTNTITHRDVANCAIERDEHHRRR